MDQGRPAVSLGEFLRARRRTAAAPPLSGAHQAVAWSRRRTPGLRREEVAGLAALSANYYTRLEQGRERHPSESVLAALAEGLQFDVHARWHLQDLAAAAAARPGTGAQVSVDSGQDTALLRDLVHDLPDAALLVTAWMDVIAANPAGRLLHEAAVADGNITRAVLLDPRARAAHPSWEEDARCAVGVLRAAAGRFPDHPRVLALHRQLTASSPVFARLWEEGAVMFKTHGHKAMRHPVTGVQHWDYQVLHPAQSPELLVLVYRPRTAERAPAPSARVGAALPPMLPPA